MSSGKAKLDYARKEKNPVTVFEVRKYCHLWEQKQLSIWAV